MPTEQVTGDTNVTNGMNAGIIEKQPTSPLLPIDVCVAGPCFQTPLPSRKENQETLHAVKQQLGTCEARKMLARPHLQTTVLSGSLLTLQRGFCVLGLDSRWLGRSLSHPLGAMFRRGQVGTEHADSTNQMRPMLLSLCWGGRRSLCPVGTELAQITPLANAGGLCACAWVSHAP